MQEKFFCELHDASQAAIGDNVKSITFNVEFNEQLSHQDIEELAQNLPGFSQLESLTIQGSGISPAGAQRLAPSLPESLITLDLSDNRLQNDGIHAIADRLHMLQELKNLYLANVDMEDNGAFYLAQSLMGCGFLTSLDVRNNKYGEAAAVAISHAAYESVLNYNIDYIHPVEAPNVGHGYGHNGVPPIGDDSSGSDSDSSYSEHGN